MENTAEIIGGLEINHLTDGGTTFDVNYTPETESSLKDEAECRAALQLYLKMECIEVNDKYDGTEPFDSIALKMQNVLTNGSVKKKVIRKGYGPIPEHGSSCNIHYNAYVQFEAQPFDSTYARKKPFTFTIGNMEVIEGLEISVCSMQINEKSQFLINPEVAYRNGGLGRIPKDAVVLFEVELFVIGQPLQNDNSEVNERAFEVVYPKCSALSLKGKSMFCKKDYTGAIKTYTEAADKLEDAILKNYDDQLKSETLLVRLYTNLLVSCVHANKPKGGCIYAQKIYQMAKNKTFEVSAKVYFNHSKCQRMLGDFNFAHKLLIQARNIEPNNANIQREFDELAKGKERNTVFHKRLARGIFS